jgi:hypothetical protein
MRQSRRGDCACPRPLPVNDDDEGAPALLIAPEHLIGRFFNSIC